MNFNLVQIRKLEAKKSENYKIKNLLNSEFYNWLFIEKLLEIVKKIRKRNAWEI